MRNREFTRDSLTGRDDGGAVSWSTSSFEDPSWHAEIAKIVRRNSTNRSDVREIALADLDLASCRSVLDLGCGFGFMTEVVAPRSSVDAHIVGIDACPGNEAPYLQCLGRAGRAGEFLGNRIASKLDWPDHTFDLVVASYSLYFFPGAIPEIARVLHPRGLFIALTHSEESVRDLTRVLGSREDHSNLLPLSRNFSAENGARLLSTRFRDVEREEYVNSLEFGEDRKHDFLAYLRFKMPFLHSREKPEKEADRLWKSARATCGQDDQVVLAKNDAVFRCRKPVIP